MNLDEKKEKVLKALAKHPKGLSVSALARESGMHRPEVYQSVIPVLDALGKITQRYKIVNGKCMNIVKLKV